MTPDEHLDAIVAKCREIIALGEKRTQGAWKATKPGRRTQLSGLHGKQVCAMWDQAETSTNNSAYIAACAGRAEAGWQSTIAAIEGLRKIRDFNAPMEVLNPSMTMIASYTEAKAQLDAILAAWQEEML